MITSHDKPLAEMILFISQRSEGDERFGAVKLNKLLFYTDFLAYLKLGDSITGQEYQKLRNGPAPRRLLPVRNALVEQGDLAIRQVEYYDCRQERTFALRPADITDFTANQIELVTRVIEDFRFRNALEMSHLSHQFHGWEDVELNETIPYEVVMVSKRKPTEAEAARCLQDAERAARVLANA